MRANRFCSLARAVARRSMTTSATEMPPTKFEPPAYTGPDVKQSAIKRKQFVGPNPGLYYADTCPVMLTEGRMQWVWDSTGKRYLDMWGGIVTVSAGHSHPKVNEAVRKQLDTIQHTTYLYLHPLQGEYAEAIVETMPKEHEWQVFFTNSGSEANDLATLLARTHTGSFEYVAHRNGYHGMTEGTRGLTNARGWRHQPLAGLGVKYALHSSKYRGAFAGDKDAVKKYMLDLDNLLHESCSPKIAGYVAEPIQGVGGVYEMEEGYFKGVYDTIRAHGGLCTADEVQTGWGRLGTHFWGYDKEGVVPDMVTTAKSIANGFPLGAVIAKKEVAQSFKGSLYFNTFGGNPVCLAAGLATLRVIQEEGLQENSRLRGEQMLSALHKMEAELEIIGDVRGRGLMVGVELVKDRATKEPATAEAIRIQEFLRDQGILVGRCGTYGNCFRFVPPMCVDAQDIDFFMYHFERALRSL